MACPVCAEVDCPYWELRKRETWHPPLPKEHLPAIWRGQPEKGSGAIMLDPREALHCLDNGATVDDKPAKVTFGDWRDASVCYDGRVTVRVDLL